MYFANDINGVRTYIDFADEKQEYFCPCPDCKERMIQKRGTLVAHHFAHKVKGACDPWYYGKMSEWHKNMQKLFPYECREIAVRNNQGEYHIADVVIRKASAPIVVEFQHSPISCDEFLARTDFYTQQNYIIKWVFDFRDKNIYYTKRYASGLIRAIWPGKDRVRFLDNVDFSKYGNALQIFFQVKTGLGHSVSAWERMEYINPFFREELFIELDLEDESFELKEFYATAYSEKDFYAVLKR